MLTFSIDPDFPNPMIPADEQMAPVMAGAGFAVLFNVVVFIALVGAIVAAVIWYRNQAKIVQSGNDPTTFETDLAIRLMQSNALAPEETEKSVGQRLAELDALHSAGTISDKELEAARARVISDV